MSTRMSNGPSITRDRGDVRTSSSLTFEFGTRKVVAENGVIVLRRPIETTALIRSLSCPTCLFSNTAHARPRELPSANTAHRLRDSTGPVIYQNGNSSLGVACRVVEKQHWWWILAMVRRRPCDRVWAFVRMCMILGIVILGLLGSTLAGLLHPPGWHSRKFCPGPREINALIA